MADPIVDLTQSSPPATHRMRGVDAALIAKDPAATPLDSLTRQPEHSEKASQDDDANLMHQFDATIAISGRRAWTRNHTSRHDWALERDRQILDFRQDVNNALWISTKGVDTSGGERRTRMDGILAQLTKSDSYDSSSFDEDDVIDLHRQIFTGNNGSKVRFHFAGSKVVQDWTALTLDKLHRRPVESRTLKAVFEGYQTSFGTTVMIYDPSFDELGLSDHSVVLDLEYIKIRYGRRLTVSPIEYEKQGKDGKGLWVREEKTILVKNRDTHLEVVRTA